MKDIKKFLVNLLPVVAIMPATILLAYNILGIMLWDNIMGDIIQLLGSIIIGIIAYIKLGVKTEGHMWKVTETSET